MFLDEDQQVTAGTISYDAKKKVMKIDDELTKGSDETTIYMGEALEEGLPPVSGVIRVSYRVMNGKKVALRVVDLERAMKLFKLKK